MTTAALIAAWATGVVSGMAGLVGGVMWWRVHQSRLFWVLIRGAQAVAVAQALVAGVLAVLSFAPDDGLYWLYALLPIGYPLGKFGPVRRAALEDVTFADRWGQAFTDV